jgi:TorA maturation chaperone TorD
LAELSQRLGSEYTRLFRGIKRGYGPPPPYESVYRGERRVIGEVTLDVMRMYRKAGFNIIDETAGPQDYLGTELKFMSFLSHDEMNAWHTRNSEEAKRLLEKEKEFLDKHLLQMVSQFSRGLIAETRETFYTSVARLTEEFTRMDSKNIEFLLKSLRKNVE